MSREEQGLNPSGGALENRHGYVISIDTIKNVYIFVDSQQVNH